MAYAKSENSYTKLYVTESEYLTIMEVCCEILFFYVVLLFMGIFVKYPITMHIGNAGAIFLSDNILVSQWKNHIDVCHHFIWEYIEERTVKIIFLFRRKYRRYIYQEPK